jgi:glucose-1-phosphate thymidylyltransferase
MDYLAKKAVILAAGLGKRMRSPEPDLALTPEQAAAADQGSKAMLPTGRPFLDYVLHELAESGLRDICLVVGPDHEPIRRYYSDLRPRRISLSFAVQPSPRGTADALLAAEKFVADESFLIMNSDNLYPRAACAALAGLDGPGLAAFEREALLRLSNMSAERIHNCAAVEIAPDGYLQRIIEKPDEATLAALGSPVYLSVNCWRMSPAIFAACRRVAPSVRGELELPDAVQLAVDELGVQFRVLTFADCVLDLSSRRDIPEVAARLTNREVDL